MFDVIDISADWLSALAAALAFVAILVVSHGMSTRRRRHLARRLELDDLRARGA